MNKRIVSEIWIYPVKSLGGIALPSAVVLSKGLEHDRRWMLIDEKGQFLTQRTHARLALFGLSLAENGFLVSYRHSSILLSYTWQGQVFRSKVWNDEVMVAEVSAAHNEFFSEHLGIRCRLVVFPEQNTRPVDPRYATGGEEVSLADGYPLLIAGQASLDDLNDRLEQQVLMNRFRPNIVFTGGAPYEEDSWRSFRIGDQSFRGVKPCSRCVVVTIDQETAIKSREPLATLAGYRRDPGKKNVHFGQNVIPVSYGGRIAVGNECVPLLE